MELKHHALIYCALFGFSLICIGVSFYVLHHIHSTDFVTTQAFVRKLTERINDIHGSYRQLFIEMKNITSMLQIEGYLNRYQINRLKIAINGTNGYIM
jgi:hypothetical protein